VRVGVQEPDRLRGPRVGEHVFGERDHRFDGNGLVRVQRGVEPREPVDAVGVGAAALNGRFQHGEPVAHGGEERFEAVAQLQLLAGRIWEPAGHPYDRIEHRDRRPVVPHERFVRVGGREVRIAGDGALPVERGLRVGEQGVCAVGEFGQRRVRFGGGRRTHEAADALAERDHFGRQRGRRFVDGFGFRNRIGQRVEANAERRDAGE
jgi:hypothetical protein